MEFLNRLMRRLNLTQADSKDNFAKLRFRYNQLPIIPCAKGDAILRKIFASVGKNCVIEKRFDCKFGYNIHIGDNFHAGAGLLLYDTVPVYFGNNVHIAANVHIHCGDYPCKDAYSHAQKPINIGNNVTIGGNLLLMSGVTVGNNCIFGTGTIVVYPGVTIGDNCVLSSGCFVTKNVPDNAMVVGKVGIIIKE